MIKAPLLYLVTIFLFVLVAYRAEKNEERSTVVKDSSLTSLVTLLNQPSAQLIFQNWSHSHHDYSLFMDVVRPWLFGKYLRPIPDTVTGPPIPVINCHNPKYSRVLSEESTQKARLVVDLIKFGYDVDKLIVRLYELYHVVDVFVIYEFPVTLIGVEKPMFFRMMVNDTRLLPFQDKLVYVWTDMQDPLLQASVIRFNKASAVGDKKGIFDLMYFMEEDIIRRFKDFLTFAYEPGNVLEPQLRAIYGSERLHHLYTLYKRLQKKILSNMDVALAVQSDGDELPLVEPMAHLRHCELDAEVVSVHLPCFHYKRNFLWLQRNYGMSCFQGADDEDRQLERFLKRFLWRTAPYVWPLRTVLDTVHTMRLNFTKSYCYHHMGLGAAVHMSAFNDPIETWMKGCGAVEERGACKNVIASEIIAAGKLSKITASMIFKSTVSPWCQHHDYSVHKDAISLNLGHVDEELRLKAIELLDKSLPWIVKQYPQNFPFLYYPQFTNHDSMISVDNYSDINKSSKNQSKATDIDTDKAKSAAITIEQVLHGKDMSDISIEELWAMTVHPRWIRLCKDSRRRGNSGQFLEVDNQLPLFSSIWGGH